MFDEVFEKLCDADVYFDTAYILRFISEDLFKKILKKHGEDKILFATDTPWSDIKTDVDILRSFALDKNIENKIWKNKIITLQIQEMERHVKGNINTIQQDELC